MNMALLTSKLSKLFDEYSENQTEEILAAANEFGRSMISKSVPLEAFGEIQQNALKLFYKNKNQANINPTFHLPVITEIFQAYGEAFRIQNEEGEKLHADLHERKEQFRGAFDTTSHGMILIALDGKILKANDTFSKITGFSAEELLTLTIKSLTHPDDSELNPEKVDELISGEIFSYELTKRLVKKGGELIWIQVNVSLARDIDSTPLYLVTQVQDITAAREAKEHLKQINQKNSLILNALGQGVYGQDLDGKCLFINPAALDLLGYCDTDITPKDLVHDFFHSEGSSETCSICAASRGNYDLEKGIATFRRKDHSEFPAKFISTHIIEDDEIVGNVVIFGDESQRLITEKSLRESEARFRALYNSTPSMLLSISPSGTIIEASDMWLQAVGYTREEVTGQIFRNYLTPQSRNEASRIFDNIHDTGKAYTEKLHYLTRSDTAIETETSAIGEYDSANNLERILAVSVDVTEKRKTEALLMQSQKMEAVGQLTGGIAHDFNNILQVILGNLQVLERKSQDMPEVLNRLHRVIGAADKARDLTKRLLAFSRRQVLETVVTNLNTQVEEFQTLLRRSLRDDIDLRLHLADDTWLCETDIAQFESAILNLCVNSSAAMPDGGLLTISTNNVSISENSDLAGNNITAGDYVEVCVSDTGHGIPENVLPHVLEPFFTTKDKGEGTGLGLSMVYGFTRQSGGYIDIKSQTGQGTQISLYFPKSITTEVDKPSAIAELSPLTASKTAQTIITVEDDPDVKDILVSLLSEYGYIVHGFEFPEDAIEQFNQGLTADLLLTDVIMPGEYKGPDLADALKAKDPSLKVLFMSGYTNNEFNNNRSLHDGEKFLSKPATDVELLSAVHNLLNTKSKPSRTIR